MIAYHGGRSWCSSPDGHAQQLVLGYDGGQDRPCRINMLQVGKKHRIRPALL
jgi:hypothetical protein